MFEDDVQPLLRSDYGFTEENFYSATLAVRDGKMFSNEGWHHEQGSNLIGWAKTYLATAALFISSAGMIR